MAWPFSTLPLFVAFLPWALAAPVSPPTVTTSYGTWQGTTSSSIDSWRGIPFAEPPVGQLRFAAPVKTTRNYGTFDASKYGKSCPQMNIASGVFPGFFGQLTRDLFDVVTGLPILSSVAGTDAAEDCLFLNVQRPAGTAPDAKLPVMVWVYGGAFLIGSTTMYDGANLVSRSISVNQPIIYVSMNCKDRLNSFGFLPGAEAAADSTVSPNAGLLDQRLALEWVQENIAAFGGDPTKVTLFGESAGAISVAFQMLAFDGNIKSAATGNDLFRAAIMQSGSPIPVGPPEYGQSSFDALVNAGGCASASDKIACLRALPYSKMRDATNTLGNIFSYRSVSLPFLPRTDGTFLTATSQELEQSGKYARLPIINGDQYDEGTILALGTLNITTEAQTKTWFKQNWFPRAPDSVIDQARLPPVLLDVLPIALANLTSLQLLALYPQDPRQGSPFNTGLLYAVTPQNKRINALVGDLVFQAPRRAFVGYTNATQPTWSFISRAGRNNPFLGSFHGTSLFSCGDILTTFGLTTPTASEELQTRWIAFANNLDPNPTSGKWRNWPQYGSTATLLQFNDGASTISTDNFREEGIEYIWEQVEVLTL
ncbi:hypothetical protein JCM11251_005817 [Rhodosporidiobolus azoricus]